MLACDKNLQWYKFLLPRILAQGFSVPVYLCFLKYFETLLSYSYISIEIYVHT